jgi:hypothetical protein
MALLFGRKIITYFLLLFVTVHTVNADSNDAINSRTEKKKYKAHSTKSKPKIDKGTPWPFLPSAGSHYSATKGYPNYPFMIVSPPGMKWI